MGGAGERHGARTPDGWSATALLLVLSVAVGCAAQGGFYDRGRWSIVAVLCAAAVLTTWSAWDGTDWRLVFVGIAFGGWAVIEVLLGGSSSAVVAVLATYVASVLAFQVSRRMTAAGSALVLRGLVAVGCVVSLVGAIGVMNHHRPWADPSEGLWRAAAGLSYANATGALLVVLGLVAIAHLARAQRSPVLAGAAAVLLGGAGATLSRGALLAAAAGLVVLGVVAGASFWRVVLGPVAGAGVVFAGLFPSMRTTAAPGPWWGWLGLAVGVALAAALGARPPRPRAAAVLVALVLLAGAGGAAVARGSLGSRWTLQTPRWDAWSAAWSLITHHLVSGVGPGMVAVQWRDATGAARGTSLLHNEYLQAVAELGLVGAGLLLVTACLVLATLRAGLRRPVTAPVLAAVAGTVAFAVQSGGDFLWHLTVLPVVAATLVGLASASLYQGPAEPRPQDTDTVGEPTKRQEQEV